jgi:hypothetical protein
MLLHASIISWGDKGPNAAYIAASLAPMIAHLTVVYSSPDAKPQTGAGHWHALPDTTFFGAKFAKALAETPANHAMLLIHADTSFGDWPHLLTRCTAAFAQFPDLALWSPDFTDTPWRTALVRLFDQPDASGLVSVIQTDGIITAFSPATVDRLRRLDLTANPLGWGIDWAALAFAYASGLRVLRDTTLKVTHPKSRGYMGDIAARDMAAFLAQLTHAERAQIALLRAFFQNRKDAARPWPARLFHSLFRMQRKDPFSGLQTPPSPPPPPA